MGATAAAGKLGNDFKIKASHYFLGGMSLAAALGWNEAIKASIKQYNPISTDTIKASFIYAIILTLILVILAMILPDTTTELPGPVQEKIKASRERVDDYGDNIQYEYA